MLKTHPAYVWICDNPDCKLDGTKPATQCKGCSIVAYCSRKCKKAHEHIHGPNCRKPLALFKLWVNSIKEFICNFKNDRENLYNIFCDLVAEYKDRQNGTVPKADARPAALLIGQPALPPPPPGGYRFKDAKCMGQLIPEPRGAMIIDISKNRAGLRGPDGKMNKDPLDQPGRKVAGRFEWTYHLQDDEMFAMYDEYADLRRMMANYDPNYQIVLCVFCTVEEGARTMADDPGQLPTCHVEEIIDVRHWLPPGAPKFNRSVSGTGDDDDDDDVAPSATPSS
jgi:hypothetical protein